MQAEDRSTAVAPRAASDPSRSAYGLSRRLLLTVALSTVVLDQVTKVAIRMWVPLYDSIPVIPGILSITYVRNTGAAFGFLNAVDIPFKPFVMTAIAVVALIGIAVYATQAAKQHPLSQVGLALVIGGAIGNLIDRVTIGYVVDFVDVYWGSWHFWAFNLADASISVGAGLLILDMVWVNRHVSETV